MRLCKGRSPRYKHQAILCDVVVWVKAVACRAYDWCAPENAFTSQTETPRATAQMKEVLMSNPIAQCLIDMRWR